MRRPGKWLLATAGAIAAMAGVGAAWQAIESRRDKKRFPAPGRMIDVGGRRWHVRVSGEGVLPAKQPVVVLESGIAASSLSWGGVQAEIARFAQVFSYDRAGLGWSDAVRGRLSLRGMVEELRSLLHAAKLQPPYVLVGHSFGGLVMRGFAAWYPEDVAGVVLVDAVVPSEWLDLSPEKKRLLRYGVLLSRRGAWLARLGVVRASLGMLTSGRERAPQAIARLSSGRGSVVIDRLVGEVRKLPRELWPLIQSHWSHPQAFHGMAAHLECLPASAAIVNGQTCSPSIPLTVLSAANASPEQQRMWDAISQAAHGQHLRAERGGHWLQLDEPELIVRAVREMVERARQTTA